jgi:hypothetical protein
MIRSRRCRAACRDDRGFSPLAARENGAAEADGVASRRKGVATCSGHLNHQP